MWFVQPSVGFHSSFWTRFIGTRDEELGPDVVRSSHRLIWAAIERRDPDSHP
jgi:hypothetical protein